MRKRQTFLITVLGAENETASFCGRVKVIATGKTYNFTDIDDLQRLITDEMGEGDSIQGFLPCDINQGHIEPSSKISKPVSS